MSVSDSEQCSRESLTGNVSVNACVDLICLRVHVDMHKRVHVNGCDQRLKCDVGVNRYARTDANDGMVWRRAKHSHLR